VSLVLSPWPLTPGRPVAKNLRLAIHQWWAVTGKASTSDCQHQCCHNNLHGSKK